MFTLEVVAAALGAVVAVAAAIAAVVGVAAVVAAVVGVAAEAPAAAVVGVAAEAPEAAGVPVAVDAAAPPAAVVAVAAIVAAVVGVAALEAAVVAVAATVAAVVGVAAAVVAVAAAVVAVAAVVAAGVADVLCPVDGMLTVTPAGNRTVCPGTRGKFEFMLRKSCKLVPLTWKRATSPPSVSPVATTTVLPPLCAWLPCPLELPLWASTGPTAKRITDRINTEPTSTIKFLVDFVIPSSLQ